MNGLVPPAWTEAVALIAFLVSSAVFGLILIAIFRLPKKRLKHLEKLPLASDETSSHDKNTHPRS